jgi:hypothetical protein
MQINKTGQSLDSFAVITVASNTNYIVGELVTGGTSGATAKVSGKIGADKLLLKSVKTGATTVFAGVEDIVGNKSIATSAMSSFSWGKETQRLNSSTGNKQVYIRDAAEITDQGVVTLNARGLPEIKTSVRIHASKVQTPAGDAAGVPTFAVKRTSKAGNFSCAKGQAIRIVLTSSEAVTVSGTPTVELVLLGTTGSRTMTYVASKSSATELMFEYELVTGDATANTGQIVSIANTWVGGTVTDLKSDGTAGTVVVPQTFTVPSVTGIIVTA